MSLKAAKILLTGASGQVGSALARTLAPMAEVHALPRHQLDLLSEGNLRAAMAHFKPDIVINAAAYTAVDQAEMEPALAFAVNADAPRMLADEAQRLGAWLVHYSTDYVFDGDKSTPYGEDDEPAPLNVYGRSKLAGELAIQQSGCRHLIFRISWIYSRHGRNFLRTMLNLAEKQSHLRVVSDQIGAPTWAQTVAEVTADVLARPMLSNGLYHLACAGEASWADFAREIFRLSGHDIAVEPISSSEYPALALRPANSRLSCQRLQQDFGIAVPDWKTALAKCWDSSSAGVESRPSPL